MLPRRKKDIRKHKAIRCKAIVLLMAMFVFIFTNTPLSFAAFVSDGKTTFTASVTIASFVDSDYDGISNNWELQFGLKPDDPDDAKHDNDNDGLTNLEEYRDNSDPTESESGVEVVLIADPTSGDQALDVTLEVQVLNDGGYDIVRYEFDFD